MRPGDLWHRVTGSRRDTRTDLDQASASYEQARQSRQDQQRKHVQETEGVTRRLDHIRERNHIADLIRDSLQQGRDRGGEQA